METAFPLSPVVLFLFLFFFLLLFMDVAAAAGVIGATGKLCSVLGKLRRRFRRGSGFVRGRRRVFRQRLRPAGAQGAPGFSSPGVLFSSRLVLCLVAFFWLGFLVVVRSLCVFLSVRVLVVLGVGVGWQWLVVAVMGVMLVVLLPFAVCQWPSTFKLVACF